MFATGSAAPVRRFVLATMVCALVCTVGGLHAWPALAAATPTVSISNASVTEGNTGTVSMSFTVTISASAKHASVAFQTHDGTATAPQDFAATSGTIRFNGHLLTRTASVPVNGDVVDEADETFTVTLSNPVGVTIDQGSATGTILDDDGPPTVSAGDTAVVEGNTGQTTTASVPVSLSTPSSFTLSVDYATGDVTATTPDDYATKSGTLTFLPGQTTAPILVVVKGDDAAEGDETFQVHLSNPTKAVLGTDSTVTVIDNDAPPSNVPTLSLGNAKIREGNTGQVQLTFTVTESKGTNTPVSVQYTTGNGTAVAPTDFVPTSGTLNIPPATGTTTANITVPVNGDKLLEHKEILFLNLVGSTNAYIVGGQGVGTVRNDDTRTTTGLHKKSG
ncbi:MAG TPA: Calx-beta domain-containing protein, partial [Actinomycetota bacterium]|nr:Calx-beta domain-containing protein [Actinomycetota bacterium]